MQVMHLTIAMQSFSNKSKKSKSISEVIYYPYNSGLFSFKVIAKS